MNFYADYIRNQLSSVIENMEHQSEKFVKNPGHDFTRNRKMNFISTINFLLTMEGGSIGAELHKYFNYDLNQTLYLIFDYPYKYYTFKHFEV